MTTSKTKVDDTISREMGINMQCMLCFWFKTRSYVWLLHCCFCTQMPMTLFWQDGRLCMFQEVSTHWILVWFNQILKQNYFYSFSQASHHQL